MHFDFLPQIDKTQFVKNQEVKVILGISGGVDSSVSAFLLQRLGYKVECLFMKNWEEDDNTEYCTAAQDLADAQQVCDKLGLKLHTINFAAEYWDNVFEDFLSEFRAGRTPNPDILCNKEIKFKAFLDYALNILEADYIATGHYVQKALSINSSLNDLIVQDDKGSLLLRGLDDKKDQTYFLYNLSPEQISKAIFPIGQLKKTDVRLIAEKLDLITAHKKDSTGICFIGERKFKDFLAQYIPTTRGDIVSIDGEIVGKHYGSIYYTIGQRKGLGIGGTKYGNDLPWYVVKKNVHENQVIVAQGQDSPKLYGKGFYGVKTNWILTPQELEQLFNGTKSIDITVKIRYRANDCAATLTLNDDEKVTVNFAQPQLAITPGQSAVYYRGDICLGGSIIDKELI